MPQGRSQPQLGIHRSLLTLYRWGMKNKTALAMVYFGFFAALVQTKVAASDQALSNEKVDINFPPNPPTPIILAELSKQDLDCVYRSFSVERDLAKVQLNLQMGLTESHALQCEKEINQLHAEKESCMAEHKKNIALAETKLAAALQDQSIMYHTYMYRLAQSYTIQSHQDAITTAHYEIAKLKNEADRDEKTFDEKIASLSQKEVCQTNIGSLAFKQIEKEYKHRMHLFSDPKTASVEVLGKVVADCQRVKMN